MYLRLIPLLMLLVFLTACGIATSSNPNANLEIEVENQDISLFTEVKIKRVSTDKTIFLVVHNSFFTGSLGEVIYVEKLEAGLYEDFDIVLSDAINMDALLGYGDILHAMLYLDSDENGEFDQDIDELALNKNGQSISKGFTVGISDTTVHARLSVEGQRAGSERWSEIRDDLDVFQVDEFSGTNITFTKGLRYSITNNSPQPLLFQDVQGELVLGQSEDSNELVFMVDEDFSARVDRYSFGYESRPKGLVYEIE